MGGQALRVLGRVVRYLRLKAPQARIALDMPAPRTRWGVTPLIREQQETARIQIAELNKRFGRGKVVAYGG